VVSRFALAKPASQNLGGALSRLPWVHSPGLGLYAGGLFGLQQSNTGGGVSFTDTLGCIDFEVLVFSKLVIDCVFM